jgi:hypothetical protein
MLRVAALLLVYPLASEAGEFLLAFEHPVPWQTGTQYQLQTRVVQGSQTVLEQKALLLLPPAECRQRAPEATEETLCARVCFDPGDYGLEVRALRARETSEYSTPLLVADLRSTRPCHPVVQAPPSTPPSTNPGTTTIAVGGVVGTILLTQGAKPPTLLELPNLACVDWKIAGVCACGFPPHPCVQVEYWEPGWLIETVLKPGQSTLEALTPLLDTALRAGGMPSFGGGGAGNATGSGHTNIHYNEVHVYGLPSLLGGPCTSCVPQVAPPTLHYASELDAPAWRTARAVPSPLDLVIQVGVWCKLYPRGGKVITGSKPVASGCTATRALDVAFLPVGLPPNTQDTHVVPIPSPGTSRCFQLAWPRQTACMLAGTPPLVWDHATVSPSGAYLWVVWKKRACCINPETTTCGITLLGGHGQNLCLLPSTPTP